jgi:hypothetical protein
MLSKIQSLSPRQARMQRDSASGNGPLLNLTSSHARYLKHGPHCLVLSGSALYVQCGVMALLKAVERSW